MELQKLLQAHKMGHPVFEYEAILFLAFSSLTDLVSQEVHD